MALTRHLLFTCLLCLLGSFATSTLAQCRYPAQCH
jgi:hypothetical protein